MRHDRNALLLLLGLFAVSLPVQNVGAQTAPAPNSSLPGGATSLNETYDDWVVSCSQRETQKLCAMVQQQQDNRTRQRVLALELSPPTGNKVDGVLLLPFGLSFEQGVTLLIDDQPLGSSLHYRTCFNTGCVVPVSFDAKTIAALRKAGSLKIKATADGGQELLLAVSLKGFAGALDRVAALSK